MGENQDMLHKKAIKWSGVVLLLLAGSLYLYQGKRPTTIAAVATYSEPNRHPQQLRFSKHARCRMDCRHIDKSEVQQLLQEGSINRRKSDLDAEDVCQRRYALEGYSNEGQQIRMIVASCGTTTTVITVIDIGEDWACACD